MGNKNKIIYEHGGNIWALGLGYQENLKDIIDFSININPLGYPKQIEKAITQNLGFISCYPDPESNNLKQKISENFKVKKDNILIGNGGSELIFSLTKAISPLKTLIPAPSFIEYEKASKSIYSKCIFVDFIKKNNTFVFDTDKALKKIKSSDMLFLCNPNNPTGSIICKDELIFIIKKCSENDCFVLLDESFIDFLEDDKEFSLLDKITKFKNAAVLRSLTKFYGIPGLRLGYIVANKALLTKIKNTQPDWPVNILAQIAGEKLFDDKNFANKTKKIIKREKEFIFLKLKDIKNLKPYNSYANFILIEILDSLISSGYLKKKLLENSNILIRDCQNFRELGSNYFRISIKKHKENNLLIESLIKIFGTKKSL